MMKNVIDSIKNIVSNGILYINKFIDKVGKINFALLVFIICVIVVVGLYTTLAADTSDNYSLIAKTYKFIIGDNTDNEITIASDSSKYLDITVSNPDDIDIKYALYYTTTSSDISIYYVKYTEAPTSGIVKAGSEIVISLYVVNNSFSDVNITLGIDYGTVNGGDIKSSGSRINDSFMFLNEVDPGSYVSYTGNNGCEGNACSGENANYVSDTDMGYCKNSNYKFTVNGWRVGYISDGTAYLVSAGAPECIATDSDGNMDNSGSDTSTYLDTANLYKHLDNLDNEALLYCNLDYAYGGVCDSTSTWAMDAMDFEAITGSTLSISSCYASSEDTNCGYGNDLIDNGGYYWYATRYGASSDYMFDWYPVYRRVGNRYSCYTSGLRPVLRLQSSVRVTGGSGTYADPYTIAN